MGIVNRIIKQQPQIIKKLYYNLIPFKYRYDKLFSKTKEFLNAVDKWSYDKAKEYQFNELKLILNHCQNNVPYYGKLFSEYGFNPNIKSLDDIKILPTLTKEIINNNFDDLISRNFNGKKLIFMEILNLFILFILILISGFSLIESIKDRNRNRKNKY